MTKISFFTPINYTRPKSYGEEALSKLSNYFYLGGAQATVVKGNKVQLKSGKISCKMVALKVASYVLLFPITLTLLAIDLVLRSRYHFVVISPSKTSKNSSQERLSKTQEKESVISSPTSTLNEQPHTDISSLSQLSGHLPSEVSQEKQSTPPLPPSKATITAQSIEGVRQEIIPTGSPKEVFYPFTVKISGKDLSPIVSKEEMNLKAQEIGQLVLDKHIKLPINIPSYGSERAQALKFIEELNNIGDVITNRWNDQFYIVPKKTEEIQENLTIRKYNNGVIEEVQSSRESEGGVCWTYWEGRRIYPDGVIETGRFDDFCWHIGTRAEKETTIYRLPDTLVKGYSLDRGLIWADIEGEKRLIVIHKKPGSGDYSCEYIQIKEELIPTLTEILKEENDVSEKSIQEILSGPINCEDFITSLFNTNSVFSLQPYPLQILLKIIKKNGLIVNLHQKHPETGETLLNRYANKPNILQILIDIDPTLIRRTEDSEIAFVRALLSGNRKGAAMLFNAMESQNIPLLPRELLFKKVAFSEGEVTLEELRSVSKEDQQIVYQLVNIYSQLNVVRTMKALGFNRSEDLLMREGPSIFGCNMDVLEMHEQLQAFLKDLRSQKLLLTQTEFNQLSTENYIEKGSDIGRILGRNYIEKKARELGLKHVKAPRKMIVIDDEIASIKLRTSAGLDIRAPEGCFTIYAERIQESNRKITFEEVSELLRLFEATGFSDIHWGNVIIAEDGVYVIDTEFTNFWVHRFYFENGSQYAEMEKIVHALPSEQQQTLIDELNIKIETYQSNEEERNEQRMLRLKAEQAALQKSGCFYGPEFTFSINELIT